MKQTMSIESCVPEAKAVERVKMLGIPDNWIQDLNEVENEVMRRVENEHNEKLRRNSEMRRINEETGKLLKEQKKRSKKRCADVSRSKQSAEQPRAFTSPKVISDDIRNLSTQISPSPSMTAVSKKRSAFVTPLELNSKYYTITSFSSPSMNADSVKQMHSSINDLNSLKTNLIRRVAKRSPWSSPKMSISTAVQKALSFNPLI